VDRIALIKVLVDLSYSHRGFRPMSHGQTKTETV